MNGIIERPNCPIFLIGMPGAGKTTIGRQLAKRMERPFLDVDQEIEARAGVRIPLIFEYEGEDGFRDRETAVLSELANSSSLIVATGGGAVLRQANRALMKNSGVTIYIAVSPHLLYERTKHDKNRPLLQVEDPLAKLEDLFLIRDPLYRETAKIVITGGQVSSGTLVRKIEHELETRCAA